MSDGFVGLDPDLMRGLAGRAAGGAEEADRIGGRVAAIAADGQLFMGAPLLCAEIAEELRLLDQLCRAKAQEMDDIGNGLLPASSGLSRYLVLLRTSLTDGVGDTAIVGDNALAILLDDFGAVDTDGDGAISETELMVAAHGAPVGVRHAAAYLLASPILLANLATARTVFSADADGNVASQDGGSFERADLEAVLVQNGALRVLSKRLMFDELDRARTGDLDGRFTAGDVERRLEQLRADPNADPAEIAAMGYLLAHPDFFERIETAAQTMRDGIPPTWGDHGFSGGDGRSTFDDVLALLVNQHAFAADAVGAAAWVRTLPATWTEIGGTSTGIDIRLSSDEGLRALAASALAGSATLLDQVTVVAMLPESRGGERNALITYYYGTLARRMDARLNPELMGADGRLAVTPGTQGHTGANWLMYAPAASDSLRPALTGQQDVFTLSPTWADRQHLADGNQYIFGDIGIRAAGFLEAFPVGEELDNGVIADFFQRKHPVDTKRPLFSEGHNQLRNGFAHFLAAMDADDPFDRQRLTTIANEFIGIHEQAGVDHALDAIIDQDVGDDGLLRGLGGEVFPHLTGRSDEELATDMIVLEIGDDRLRIPVESDLQPGDGLGANLIDRESLTGSLNPANATQVEIAGDAFGLDGRPGDVVLEDLGGWDRPPPGSGMDEFPVDAREWVAGGRGWFGVLGDDQPLLGSGASNWGVADDRMYTIVNMFQQLHTDPVLWQGLADRDLSSTWFDERLGYLPANVAEVTR